MDERFDIVVIGGGAGGLFAASVANALGAKTCMIDKEKLGGDCTWYGCIPSKALINSAHIAALLKKASNAGLTSKNAVEFDTGRVMEHVRGIVKEISEHHPPEVFEKRGISVRFGRVRFTGKNTIDLDGQPLSAKKFIICTGTHPVIPPIPGLENLDYLTNETIFKLDKLPKSLIVLGAGPIGLELAQSFARLGVEVSVVEMLDRILIKEDKDISQILSVSLVKEGLRFYLSRKAVKCEKMNGMVSVSLENREGKSERIEAEKILVAVGRAPNVKDLGLENCGVEYSGKGLRVNEYLQTTNKDIFACGDIASPYQFSHVAAYQASVCVRNAFFKRIAWAKIDYSNIAWATFTDPEVSHLGMTEAQAREKPQEIKVYSNGYGSSDRAVTDMEKNGLVKIITDKKGYILGASIVGAKASELMQGLIVAKSQNIPLAKISSALFIYPTLSEVVKKTAAKALLEKMSDPLLKLLLKIMRR